MSKANEYAERCKERLEGPNPFHSLQCDGNITEDGHVILTFDVSILNQNRAKLVPCTALALGKWLVAMFGEGGE